MKPLDPPVRPRSRLAALARVLGLGRTPATPPRDAERLLGTLLPGFPVTQVRLSRTGDFAVVEGGDDGLALVRLRGGRMAARRLRRPFVLDRQGRVLMIDGAQRSAPPCVVLLEFGGRGTRAGAAADGRRAARLSRWRGCRAKARRRRNRSSFTRRREGAKVVRRTQPAPPQARSAHPERLPGLREQPFLRRVPDTKKWPVCRHTGQRSSAGGTSLGAGPEPRAEHQ